MYWLPPKSLDVDINVICERLLQMGLSEQSYPGIDRALNEKIRGPNKWSFGDDLERSHHLKRNLLRIYHPDNHISVPEITPLFDMLTKSINHEITLIENHEDFDDDRFEVSNKFTDRFKRKDTSQTSNIVLPVYVTVTIDQLYRQENVIIPDIEKTVRCDGDINDNQHIILGDRQIIFRIEEEMDRRKDGLNYIVTIKTNPIQQLYYPFTVILPDSKKIKLNHNESVYHGLGFKGKDAVGDLVIDFKCAKLPSLSKEIKQKLHQINLEVYYNQ